MNNDEEAAHQAWLGRPRNLRDAVIADALELIPVMGNVSRFEAALKAPEEKTKLLFGFTWLPSFIPIRTIRYLLEGKGE